MTERLKTPQEKGSVLVDVMFCFLGKRSTLNELQQWWKQRSISWKKTYTVVSKRLSHNTTKAHATMLISIMGSNSLALLGSCLQCLARRKEKAWIQVFVLFPCLTLKHYTLSFNQDLPGKSTVTHNNFLEIAV